MVLEKCLSISSLRTLTVRLRISWFLIRKAEWFPLTYHYHTGTKGNLNWNWQFQKTELYFFGQPNRCSNSRNMKRQNKSRSNLPAHREPSFGTPEPV